MSVRILRPGFAAEGAAAGAPVAVPFAAAAVPAVDGEAPVPRGPGDTGGLAKAVPLALGAGSVTAGVVLAVADGATVG
jgi:hypothetical protein